MPAIRDDLLQKAKLEKRLEQRYVKRDAKIGEIGSDLIIIPGDLFDTRAPKPDVLAEAINIFRSLSNREWKASVTKVESTSKAYTRLSI